VAFDEAYVAGMIDRVLKRRYENEATVRDRYDNPMTASHVAT
jgi:hypothetical protein